MDAVQIQVGEKVVVPGCDVGEVVALEPLDFGDSPMLYFQIQFPEGSRTWIPQDRLIEKGVRRVMPAERAREVFEIAASQEAPEKRATWNRRQRRYQEILLNNEPRALAEMLGELSAVQRDRGSLSFGERRVYDQVRSLLISELALALGTEREAAEQRLDQALAG